MKRQRLLDTPLDDDYVSRIAEIRKNKGVLYGTDVTNAFLYCMDIGVLFHYAEMYDSSNVYLLEAERIFDNLFTKSVSNEVAALLVNDNVRPYRSKPYELTVLHQLTALNFMAMGKFEDALVETRKMQIYFNEWERIEANAKIKGYHTDGMFHLFSSLGYEKQGEVDNSLISLFKSIAAYKLGPVKLAPEVEGFAYDRLTAGDRAHDVEALGIGPDSGPNKWDVRPGASEIVIVGYAGKGPKMVEQNWRGRMITGGSIEISTRASRPGARSSFMMASPLVPDQKDRRRPRDGEAIFISVSLPDLITVSSETRSFEARIDGVDGVFESVVVNDINLQAQKALDDSWGAIVGRTALRVVLRTIAADQTNKAVARATKNPLIQATAMLATNIASDQMEKADIRMCFLLPRQITITRIPVEPGTHNVRLDALNRRGGVIGGRSFDGVEVKKGEKKVLFCRSFF